MRRMVQSLSTR
ncbi:hypothetical protein ACHAWT_000054 [Skeletonema menzelii]